MPDRFDILRDGLTRAHRVIEIGPCHNPIFPKHEGWAAWSIDHANQAALQAKYSHDPSVDPARIEPVDFVWTGGSLSAPVAPELLGTFDAFVASHVVEHTPDLVTFLAAAETLVKPDGRVVLAVPDKRVCFDFYRPVSSVGDVLEAAHQQRTRHSRKTLWDHAFHLATMQGRPGWVRSENDPLDFAFHLRDAANFVDADTEGYVDAHAWVFVPASFELIILCLARLGMTDWQVSRLQAAEGTEFYVWLERGGKAAAGALSEEAFSRARHALLDAVMRQLGDSQIPQAPVDTMAAVLDRLALQAELDAKSRLVSAMRETFFWKTRTRMRRALRLGGTVADA